jgi:hypothetical protein
MKIEGDVALVVNFLKDFFDGDTSAFTNSIDENATLFGKNKTDFVDMVKPKRSVSLISDTVAQTNYWVSVEFDSDSEELKLYDGVTSIAFIRFSFFVQVVNGKIMELRDYIGIKNERGRSGDLHAYLCWPSRCSRGC